MVYLRLAPTSFTSPVVTLSIVALRAANGAPLWRYTTTLAEIGNMGAPNIYPPATAGGMVFVTEDGGALTALNAQTGRVIWSVNIDTTPRGYETYPYSVTSPVVAGGVVFVIVNDALVAVRASDGKTLWRAPCGTPDAGLGVQSFPLVVAP